LNIYFTYIIKKEKIMSAYLINTGLLTLTNSISGSAPVSMACQSAGLSGYTIVLPNAAGTIGQSLVVGSVSGPLINLAWTGGDLAHAPTKPTVRIAPIPSVAIIEKK
jgi:hypothetical protein